MTAGEPSGNVDDDLHGEAAFARHSLYIYLYIQSMFSRLPLIHLPREADMATAGWDFLSNFGVIYIPRSPS